MPFSIKTKQVAGVTALVGVVVILLSAWYLATIAGVYISETKARADLVARTILQRSFDIVASGGDPHLRLQADQGLQSILQGSVAHDRVMQYAAIVDVNDVIIAHHDPAQIGKTLAPAGDLAALADAGPITQVRALYAAQGQTYEVRYDLALLPVAPGGSASALGSIRVAVSTLLILPIMKESLTTPALTALVVLIGGTLVAMLLAQIVLRPIHVIRSGLARLGRGELDIGVDLPREGELADLGDSLKAISARLAADRAQLAGQKPPIESVVEHLEDAVALFAPDGTLLFANPAMRLVLDPETQNQTDVRQALPKDHPYRVMVEDTLSTQDGRGPLPVSLPATGERLVVTHLIRRDDKPAAVVLIARNLAYLNEVESTLSYSRKVAALGRLSAGIAHEVKNPLNATMIHLELLKMQLAESPAAMEHLQVIANQVRRLDEVVQGFLKFTRPEDLKLQPTPIAPLVQELMPIIQAEAEKSHVDVRVECPPTLPPVNADPGMLQQAFLNLALNACQAMPNGGRLRIAASARPNRRVEIVFEDTGAGIAPKDLARIFDLYFTTKPQGTGIGLSMVYRAVQLHDGDIEVQSVPERGTTFRIRLRQA